MKKNLFVEPSLELERFAVQDNMLIFGVSGTTDENELDPAYDTNAIG